jgi:hypothetical protein
MSGDLILGRWGSGRGYYYLSGGSVKMASSKSFCVSSAGYGYLMISGTGVADIRNAYMHIVGNFNNTDEECLFEGSVHLASGGKILVSQMSGAAGCIKLHKSTARFYCEGGTIQADGNCPNLFFGDGHKEIDICEGGLVLDTGSHSVATAFALGRYGGNGWRACEEGEWCVVALRREHVHGADSRRGGDTVRAETLRSPHFRHGAARGGEVRRAHHAGI